ncbi:proteasome subunit alpha type-2-A [Tubulinosema ratisbonensis]|uniref:Proteasome subunit alpha type-2-A n=1 Tax=Tubulinosema ratisbonensis TaxID=291195 RepID=A0A437AJM6_9MICR|nr:proteasome subunit alpha type-2-A [Tubulinosema ratisbonensis]
MNFEKEKSQTVFSSDGKLEQCDNALTAAINGKLSVGASASDGCVICSLKDFSPLVVKEEVRKVFKVCDTIGMTYSGLQCDFRKVYMSACKIAEDYRDVYGKYPFVDVFTFYLSKIFQDYTQKGGQRPLGNLVLVCGPMLKKSEEYDIVTKHELISGVFQIDPYGSFKAVNAGAIGKDYPQVVKYITHRLETTDDNILTCVKALKEYAGAKITECDVDIGVYRLKDNIFTRYSLEQVKEVFDSMDS